MCTVTGGSTPTARMCCRVLCSCLGAVWRTAKSWNNCVRWKISIHVMVVDELESLGVDTPEDLKLVEKTLREKCR